MAEVKTNLAMKLHKVMSTISEVPKTGWNQGQKYAYHTDSDILTALKPLLAKERLVILPSLDWEHGPAVTKDGNLTTVFTKYTIIDIDTGEREEIFWSGQGADPGDKGANKAFTASGKYAMIKLFMIASEEDADATSGEVEVKTTYAPTPRPAPAPVPATGAASTAPPPPKPAAAPTKAPAKPASERCEGCDKGVPPGVAGYSRTNFKGHVFCMDCQHKVDKDTIEEVG